MQWTQVSETGTFGYMAELEPIFGALGLLMGEKASEPCVQLYGEAQVNAWRERYCFLFEAFQAIQGRNPWGILDFLLDVPLDTADETYAIPSIRSLTLETFTLESYRDHILSLPQEEILWVFLEPRQAFATDDETKAVLRQALTEDEALDRVYDLVAKGSSSFLGFFGFVRQNRRFVRDFFDLAKQLRTESLAAVLTKQAKRIAQMLESVAAGVAQLGELAFSEAQLGKTFGNRGPYEEFLFLPCYLMPGRACRFFHPDEQLGGGLSADADALKAVSLTNMDPTKASPLTDGALPQAAIVPKRQILFLSLRQPGRRREDTLRTLKAVADSTRYQILTLLADKGPLRGLDIAREVSIATSTVSHHMEQLKEGGWITEEQVKNAKYYGLNRKNAEEFMEELQRDLGMG